MKEAKRIKAALIKLARVKTVCIKAFIIAPEAENHAWQGDKIRCK
ncbi:hypothetical protein [Photobacterium sp. TLY01]|nr:hypothetical protein [Photobacterium sp. TLY01]